MPTISTTNHDLQFGSNTPTVSIYGTDTSGYITYQMSGSFHQFEPGVKYFALLVNFDSTQIPVTDGYVTVTITSANSYTEQVLASPQSIGFYVDSGNFPGDVGSDIQTTYFKISAISSTVTILGPGTLAWTYEVSIGGDEDAISGGGSVTSVATDATLTGGPITSSGTLGINLAHANTWSAKQTFNAHVGIDGYTIDLSAGAINGQILQHNGTSFVAATKTTFINEAIIGGTPGSLLYVNSTNNLAQDNTNLFWNATNKQLGIGTNSTDANLTIISPSIEQGNFVFDLNMTNGDRVIIDDGASIVVTGSANWGSGLFSKQVAVDQTISPALSVEASDAASVGHQINSAALMFRTNGWLTPSNGSYSLDMIMYVRPTNVATPRASLVFTERIIGSPTYNEVMNLDYSGSLTLLGNTSSSSIQFSAGSSAAVSSGNTGKIRYNESTHIFEQSLNGAAYAAIGGAGLRVIPAGFPTNSVLGTPTVVGAIFFNPGDYTFTTLKFRAVIANGTSAVSSHVKLHDVTNNVDIKIFTLTGTTADTKLEQVITVSSAGTNTIANSEVCYEVSIYVDTPTGGTNYIQLYSAEFRVS